MDIEYIKKNLYGLIEKNIEIRQKKKIDTHVLLIKENKIFSSISIEFGIVSQGLTLDKCLENLETDIIEKIKFYIKTNNLKNIFEAKFNNLWPVYMRYNEIFKILYLSKLYNQKIDGSIFDLYPYLHVLTREELMEKIVAYKSKKLHNSDTGFVLSRKKSA